jgi:hypothetical protein
MTTENRATKAPSANKTTTTVLIENDSHAEERQGKKNVKRTVSRKSWRVLFQELV